MARSMRGATDRLTPLALSRRSREGLAEGFTKQYGVKQLVWFEIHAEIVQAITREKQIKKWNRDWKVNLIPESNPGSRGLFDEIAIQRFESGVIARLRRA